MRPILAALAMVAAPTMAQGYDGFSETSRYIDSFDGTRIAVTVLRPTLGGKPVEQPLPVIVTQDRSADPRSRRAEERGYFLQRGYVIVAQDRRGTGASFGVQKGFVNAFDAQDAKAVIEWAATQPFSTGKIVGMGCSNQGAWQYLVATLKPRPLVAIAPACASPQFFDHGVINNGVPIFPAGPAPFDGSCGQPAAGPPPRPVDDDKDGALLQDAQKQRGCNAPMLGQYWRTMSRDGLNAITGTRPGLVDSAITNWHAVRESGIPILQIGGWFDAAVLGQMQGQRLWGGKVIMGPWAHGNVPPRGSSFPNATHNLLEETANWFDHYAKGVQNGAEKPGIRFYTTNAPAGQEWEWLDKWPGVADARTSLWFTPAGLSRKAPQRGGQPATHRPQETPWFDGAYQPLAHWWNGDMAANDAKSLSHDSEPLRADTRVTGTPTAHLWIAADTPDANVYAVLEDVAPDGRSTYVSDGVLRASWRRRGDAPFPDSIQHWKPGYASDLAPLKPGEPAELVFELYPVSHIFRRGHRMRISITTAIGKPFQAPPLAQGASPTLTLFRDAAHPSRLELPAGR